MRRPKGLNTKVKGQFKSAFPDPPTKSSPEPRSLARLILTGDPATLEALGLSKDEAKKRLNEFWAELKVNDTLMERWYRSIFIKGQGNDRSTDYG